MKKLLAIIFAIVCMLSMCFGCASKELQMDTEYVYKNISFKKSKDITLADVSSFIPPIGEYSNIKTVKEFEEMLIDNINTYCIYRHTENGNERIYLKPSILSVRVMKDNSEEEQTNRYSLWLKYEDEEGALQYDAVREGETFIFADSLAPTDFYFSNGMMHYNLEFNEKFAVVYNYAIK